MAASAIKAEFLHCDQGMGSLVKIYNSAGKLENIVLIDLGSDTKTKRYADNTVPDIVEALEEMQTDGFDPHIALLIVSHQDYDHWSLLPDLIDEIIASLPTTTVSEIYYGGARWKPEAVAALKAWERQFGISAVPMPRAHSDYDTPGSKTELATVDGVVFRVLAVNVPCSRSADDLIRNGTSAVMVAEFGNTHCIFPGDATADTIGFINTRVFAAWQAHGSGVPTRPCRALSAPHHGALRTIASNFTSTNPRLDFAKAFSEYVEAENVIASAGYYSHHKHPNRRVMEQLGVKAVDTDAHGFVVYNDVTKKWQEFPALEKGLYSTIVTLAPPPERLGWTFTIDAAGRIFFELEKRRRRPTGPRRERYPAVPASLRNGSKVDHD
jgi:beta-lactamase superfamily II metal-dependent hydrolase